MRKRLLTNRRYLVLIIIFCLYVLSACTSTTESGAQEEKKAEFSDDEVKARAMDYLEKYWRTTKKYDFEEFKAEYLEPGNTFFNLEMEIRSEVSALEEEYFEVLGDRITEEELFLREDLEFVGVEDYYVVTGHGNKLVTHQSDGVKVPGIDTDIRLTIKPIDHKLLIVDYVDTDSSLFNKDMGIDLDSDDTSPCKYQELRGTHVPYGQNQMTEAIITDAEAEEMSENELKEMQLKNIESAREFVRNRHQTRLDELKK